MVSVNDQLFHLQILDAAAQYGDSIAMTDIQTGENVTFSELRNKSYNFANALRLLGAKKGDIVILCLENCYQYAIIFLDELERILKLTNAKFVITSSKNYHVVLNFATQCELIIIGKHIIQFGNNFDHLIKISSENDLIGGNEKDITLNDILLTPFSSGTTGPAKCVQLTHRNFNVSTAILKNALFDKLSNSSRRVTIGALPFYHGSGFWALCYCLLEGHQTIIMGRFHLALMLSCIQKHKVDILNVVPAILELLCQDEIQTERWNLSSITTVLCGSAPLSRELSKRFLHKFPHVINLIQGYGMTEVVVLSHLTPFDTPVSDDHYLGSCGKLLPGFEALLLDEETNEVQKEPLKPGELLLRSETIMKGDVMYFDSDGFYFIVGRKKDLIKVNGMQVSPTELEDVLKCHRNISDAGVVGIPDKDHGQVPKAFVVLVDDEAIGFQPCDLIKYVNDRVAPHKHLRGGIEVVKKLPKTASGKLSRKDLSNA
uniref:Uncharacterized protein n=1 Tax=Setaria digitata TaxID=48799 RepID=A0A915PGN0_9BILA